MGAGDIVSSFVGVGVGARVGSFDDSDVAGDGGQQRREWGCYQVGLLQLFSAFDSFLPTGVKL